MSAIPLIEVQNLHKSFGSNHVLNGISFKLFKGESFVVIGGSGTGKSVLIKCIIGLLRHDEGDIFINGQNTKSMTQKQRRESLKKFGMLFQGGALFDSMTVGENIAFGLEQGFGVPKDSARKIAIEKLKAVDLEERVANVFPAELSGGMQKRVALARAIATTPEVIFFDEPTTGLDPIISGTINDLILKCVKGIGASALTITHDMHSLRTIADRVALLFQGKLIWIGSVKEMDETDNPYVKQFINGLAHGPFTDN